MRTTVPIADGISGIGLLKTWIPADDTLFEPEGEDKKSPPDDVSVRRALCFLGQCSMGII